ncbi:BTAD domain-containing putative transcriptional regulator [Flindersiella endophytica]
MRIGVLGPLEVWDDQSRPVEVGGFRLRALLARLALDPGRIVTTDALIDGLWGEEPPAGAVNALQSLMSRLRRVLQAPDLIESQPSGYRLALDTEAVDVHRFERLAGEGRAALTAKQPERAADRLRAAGQLWRGPALSDVLEAPFATAPAARLEELRLAATEDWISAELELGRHAEVVADLEPLAAAHPLRERLQGLLMRALYAVGRQSEALAVYERVRAALADELGTDPGEVLAAIHLAVLRQEPEAGPRRRRQRIQVPLTSFVGRETELVRLGRLVEESRLVTVIGPGGAGKTRLTVQLLAKRADEEGDQAWFVELASVADPIDVVQAVATAVGVREAGILDRPSFGHIPTVRDATTSLIDALAHRQALLVLDNCEHVVEAAAQLADRLLTDCPDLRILTTSRESLGVAGEMQYPIPPLGQPADGTPASEAMTYPAVRLFADRARGVVPDFAVTEANVGAVAEICRRLDGMPLAIELAAARLRVLSPAQIASRLDDRFRLLTGGSRTALPRHQTLRAVVEWSWDLLDERERTLARRLAVFPSGATLDAAEAVCAGDGLPREQVLDVLDALVDKSLLESSPDETTSETRYRMLETVRAYAADHLAEAGETDAVRHAHARYYTEFVEAVEPSLRTKEQLRGIARMRADYGNVIAGVRWAVDHQDADLAVRFGAALMWYWFMQGLRAESSTMLAELANVPGEAPPTERAVVWMFHGISVITEGSMDEGQEWIAKAQRLSEQADLADYPMLMLLEAAMAMFQQTDRKVARERLTKVLPRLDPWSYGLGLFFRGAISDNEGEVEASRTDFRAAKEVFRELGDRWGLAMTMRVDASTLSLEGDHAGAIAAFEDALRLIRELGSVDDEAETMIRIASERARAGEVERARREIREALALAEYYGQSESMVWAHCALAEIAVAVGDLAEGRAELELARTVQVGKNSGPPQIRTIVLSQLADVEILEGNAEAAAATIGEAVACAMAVADLPMLAIAIQRQAGLALLEGHPEQAAFLLGVETKVRGVADRSGTDPLRTEERVRELLGPAAFSEAYDSGLRMPRDEAVRLVSDGAEPREAWRRSAPAE